MSTKIIYIVLLFSLCYTKIQAQSTVPNNHYRGGENKGYTLDMIKYNKSELYFDNKKIAVLKIPKDKKHWSYFCLKDNTKAGGFNSVADSVKAAIATCQK